MRKNNHGRRALSLLLSLMLVVSTVTGMTVHADTSEDGVYEYSVLEDGTIEITDYYGSENDLVIPSEIDGYTVTKIGYRVFYYADITSVSIPDTVTEIGPYAFEYCRYLTKIVIPNSVVVIGNGAFEDCYELSEITLPEHEMEIAPDAFDDTAYFRDDANWKEDGLYIGDHKICGLYRYEILDDGSIAITDYYGFEDDLVIPSEIDGYTVTKIGQEAFSEVFYESAITSVSIPDTVTEIGAYAFEYCRYLTKIVIPNSVVVIGNGAFEGCYELSNIELPQHEIEIAPDAFDRTNDYYNEKNWVDGWFYIGTHKIRYAYDYNILENGTAQITDYNSPEKNVVIPSEIDGYSVTEIGSQAFYYSSIESVVVPDGVIRIGEGAFTENHNLTEIILPEHEMEISPDAFDSTDYYENPENWKNDWLMIGNHKIVYAFEYEILENGTASITGFNSPQQEVIIPSEIDGYLITEIGNGAFSWNDSIISVVIPESVTCIGASAFYDCNSLTQVSSPEHQMTVASNAFKYTPYFNDIRNWKDYWLMIDNNKAIYAFLYYMQEDNTIVINGYISPEKNVYIPYQIDGHLITAIGSEAFSGKTEITSVTIPDGVIEIRDRAFEMCYDLSEITLPNHDLQIAESAFWLTKYSDDIKNWKDDYLYIDSHKAGYAFGFEIEETECTASLSGYYSPESEVKIPSTYYSEYSGKTYPVVEVNGWSFNNNSNITSVTIPSGVKSIGRSAFENCTALTEINLPDGIETIEVCAFKETGYAMDRNNWTEDELNIGSYKIMDAYGYKIIENGTAYLYEYIKPEKQLVLPSEIDGHQIVAITNGYSVGEGGIVNQSFANHVENIVIPKSIISGSRAFYGNTSLKTITVSEDNPVYSSKDGVMFNKDQTELLQYPSQNERTNYTIPNTVTSIAYGSFSCASSLKSITIPASVNSIDSTCLDYSQVTTIYGEPGSYAEKFAKLENLTFIPIEQEITPNPDSNIKVTEREDGILLSNVQPGSTVSEITAELMPGSYVIADKNGKVLDDTDTIGTGTTISVYAGDQIVSQATVVILGDTTGDGIINVMDLSQIQNHVLGLQQMDEVSAAAVQFGKDTVGVSSLLTVNAHVLNLQLIDQGMSLV